MDFFFVPLNNLAMKIIISPRLSPFGDLKGIYKAREHTQMETGTFKYFARTLNCFNSIFCTIEIIVYNNKLDAIFVYLIGFGILFMQKKPPNFYLGGVL